MEKETWWPGGAREGRGQLWGRQQGGDALCPGHTVVSGLEASPVLTVWPLFTAARQPAGTWLWPERGASHAPSPGSRGLLLISVQAALCHLLPAPTVMDRGSYRKEIVTTVARLCRCSVAKSCPTLCSPMDCSTPGFPVLRHLPKFSQTHVHWVGDAMQPSHPLSSPCPSAFNLSHHQSFPMSRLFVSSGQVLELQHQCFWWILRAISFRMDWFDLLAAQGTLRSLLQCRRWQYGRTQLLQEDEVTASACAPRALLREVSFYPNWPLFHCHFIPDSKVGNHTWKSQSSSTTLHTIKRVSVWVLHSVEKRQTSVPIRARTCQLGLRLHTWVSGCRHLTDVSVSWMDK